MNILFVNTFDVSPYLGGTERITDTLCRQLREQQKCRCYLAYFEKISDVYRKTAFDGKLYVESRKNIEPLIGYILKNDINVVLLQGQLGLAKFVRKALGENPKIRIIFAHHLYPGVEKDNVSFSNNILKRWNEKNMIVNIVRLISYPILKGKYLYTLPSKYRDTYLYSDKVVLLSSKLIKPFASFGGIKDTSKFCIIPNALSYNIFFCPQNIQKKEKIVLIVSRLVENPKRISLALKAWKVLMNDKSVNDWKLMIVGTGKDENKYKRYVGKNDIKNISFEGNKNPFTYYQKASIFLMTSSLESWGLTITEAQQFGVVPIAFDSYPSLCEIIENNRNGIIVENNSLHLYIDAIKDIMLNINRREHLANNSIESVRRFSTDHVLEAWSSIFREDNL